MKIIQFLIFLILSTFTFSQSIEIKSLKVYPQNDPYALPVLTGGDFLNIDFDVKSQYVPNFNIVFRFCDRDWKPTDNIFLKNEGNNISYFLDYFDLPVTVKDANYHFSNKFPDKNGYINFPFSGKYRFYVVDSQDTSIVYAEGRFYVVKEDLPIDVKLKRETLDDKYYYPPDYGRVFWVTTELQLTQDFSPFDVDEVEIIQNKMYDRPYIVNRKNNITNRFFEWDGASRLKFLAKDVRPGNEYRQTDLRNANIYNSDNVKAQFDGIEYTRFYQQGSKDLNGSFSLTKPKDPESKYLNVNFTVKPVPEITSDVYLVGEFSDWNVKPQFKMLYDYDTYSLQVPLKRGLYDYQYVVVNGDYELPENQDWYALEGNMWETSNEFNIFVYYRDPNYGGYDRIIGYSKVVTK